jgi:hypothetical protein
MSVNGIPRGEPIITAVTQECLNAIGKELFAVTQACYLTVNIQSKLNEAFCSKNCTEVNQRFINSVKETKLCTTAPNIDALWSEFQKDRTLYCQLNAKDSDAAKASDSISTKPILFLVGILLSLL